MQPETTGAINTEGALQELSGTAGKRPQAPMQRQDDGRVELYAEILTG
jgi:hypothetical protein